MSAITASAVKELRELSGAGMMDAKKALEETNGDIEAAVDLLRAKGLATAAKKSSRTAAEGLVGVAVEGTKGTAIEVNSQTDFVAKNEQFQEFVAAVSQVALGLAANDADAVLAAPYGAGETVQDRLTNNIATIGENQVIRRVKSLSVSNGRVVSYVHNAAAPGMGGIGVLVALESEADAATLHCFHYTRESTQKNVSNGAAVRQCRPCPVRWRGMQMLRVFFCITTERSSRSCSLSQCIMSTRYLLLTQRNVREIYRAAARTKRAL